MSLVAHRVGLEKQLRQLPEWIMEEGGLSIETWRHDNPETGECEWFMIVSLHWLDKDYVPHSCVLDMRETSLPETSVTVYLRKFAPNPFRPIIEKLHE